MQAGFVYSFRDGLRVIDGYVVVDEALKAVGLKQ
jgi:hypothetical protein